MSRIRSARIELAESFAKSYGMTAKPIDRIPLGRGRYQWINTPDCITLYFYAKNYQIH